MHCSYLIQWHRRSVVRGLLVRAYVDVYALIVTADVSINDGTGSYSIVEFSLIMALVEIAHTIRTDVDVNNF